MDRCNKNWIAQNASRLALIILVGFSCTPVRSAPTVDPNPALYARVNGIDGEETHRPLELASLKINVELFGTLAKFVVNAQFANSSDETLEGIFALELPPDATVTGYALDVSGHMIDGVLASQPKARAAFERRVRRARDPGLAVMSRANVFSTRVYPIEPKKGRRIQLTFVAPVDHEKGISVPLYTVRKLRNVEFQVQARSIGHAPKLTWPIGAESKTAEVHWQSVASGFSTSLKLQSQRLDGRLILEDIVPIEKALVTRHANGQRFFQIDDYFAMSGGKSQQVDQLRIYWDRSLSRRNDDIESELALLQQYLRAAQPKSIELVTFNSSGYVAKTLASSAVVGELRSTVYRGATSFDVMHGGSFSTASTCLLFSDGLATIDRGDQFRPNCRLMAITSASGANRGFLRRLVGPSGGRVISTKSTSVEQATQLLLYGAPQVIDVSDESGAKLPYATLGSSTNRYSIVGRLGKDLNLRVTLSDGVNTSVRAYSLNSVAENNSAGALWATQAIASLSAMDDQESAVQKMSRQFSVASAAMAFIVLESPSDYASSGIEPPKNIPAEWRADYLEERSRIIEEEKSEKENRLHEVVTKWNDLKSWWETDFRAMPPSPTRVRRESIPVELAAPAASPSSPSTLPVVPNVETPSLAKADAASSLEMVVVTGAQIQSPGPISGLSQDDVASTTEIKLAEWNPRRPYLSALNAAWAKNEFSRVMEAQQAKYGSVPAFYFDVSEWLYRKHHKEEAIEMLLSALDLPSRDEQTDLVVADRLLRYESLDRAIWLYDRLSKLIDERPQPRRALALALAKRAKSRSGAAARSDLQRAVGLLHEIVMRPWNDAYDGIEIIALMEANTLIPRLRALGGNADIFDSRLIALLDVDIRVTIEWNTAATDMDLWIDEPTKERAMYSNSRTGIGGRLSNDMTNGFGPEEYLLRRAKDGTYEIRADVFASDSINPNGATIITARLYRDFGRPSQSEEVMSFELLPKSAQSPRRGDEDAEDEDDESEDENNKLIGRFLVKGKDTVSSTDGADAIEHGSLQ